MPQSKQNPEFYIEMGRLGAPHGLRGAIRIHPFTRSLMSLADFRIWWIGSLKKKQRFELNKTKASQDALITSFKEVVDRTQAEKLKGKSVYVPRALFPELAEGEFYWVDLIGLGVVNLRGENLGKINHLLETGANQVMVVRDKMGSDRLIPYIQRVVSLVDINSGRLVVDWETDY